MKKAWVLDQDSFDTLLEWLDPNRDLAGSKYETIRTRLIKIFTCRGCAEAEECADETINRAASKLHEIKDNWEGDPALYFYKIAQYVFQEWLRKTTRQGEMPAQDPSIKPAVIAEDNSEVIDECLAQCLQQVRENERTLVIEYYQERGQAKIDHHKQMAITMGIAVNALRIRACRIRRQLKNCVQICVDARLNRNGFNM